MSKAVNKGVSEMVAFAWVDHDMHFFIVTRRYIEEVQDVSRQRWSQLIAYMNTDYQIVDLDILQPVSEEMYYYT